MSARDWIGKEFWPFTCGKERGEFYTGQTEVFQVIKIN